MTKGLHVPSEIGKLRKVCLHRPGDELLNLPPDELERLLFDDVPFLEVAQQEHDTFAQILRDQAWRSSTSRTSSRGVRPGPRRPRRVHRPVHRRGRHPRPAHAADRPREAGLHRGQPRVRQEDHGRHDQVRDRHAPHGVHDPRLPGQLRVRVRPDHRRCPTSTSPATRSRSSARASTSTACTRSPATARPCTASTSSSTTPTTRTSPCTSAATASSTPRAATC